MATFITPNVARQNTSHSGKTRRSLLSRIPAIAATRRALIGSGASLLLLGAAEAGQAKAPELDRELLAACRDFERAQARLDYLNEHSPHAPYGDPRAIAHEAEIDAANDAWADAVESVTAQPARTPEGLRAKASVARMALEEGGGLSFDPEEELAISVLSDVVSLIPGREAIPEGGS